MSNIFLHCHVVRGHATLNTKQSIGVAHEFSVDDICME